LLGLRLHHVGGDLDGQLALAGIWDFGGAGFSGRSGFGSGGCFGGSGSFSSRARFRVVVFSGARFGCQ
jgi:hypothetical protein